MSKELIISATRHETRVATLEDDQLVEIAIERTSEHALAGNIYKGRVSRVLPGMQSAFVKIGLERDAFLYVSDVLDETAEHESGALDEEGDALLAEAKSAPSGDESDDRDGESDRRPRRGDRRGRSEAVEAKPERSENGERPEREDEGRRGDRRGRRGRRRRGGPVGREDDRIPQEKFAAIEGSEGVEETPGRSPVGEDESDVRVVRSFESESYRSGFEVLPGESLAKYGARELEDEGEIEYEADVDESDVEQVGAAVIEEDDEPLDSEDVEDSLEAPVADEAEKERDERVESVAAAELDVDAALEAKQEVAEAAAEEEPEEGADDLEASSEDEEPAAAEASEEASGEEVGAEASSESAEVRERDGSRYLRRGRRGRRRGGRGRRDGRERGDGAAEGAPQAEAAPAEDRRQPGFRSTEEGQDRRRPAARVVEDESEKPPTAQTNIADLLKPGQEVIVQVAKEPLGKKGARITAHVALPGRHLVYMPTVAHVGVSRKIGSDAERARLRRVIKENSVGIPGGFIVRTAGQGASDEELKEDIRFLANLWKAINEKAERRPAPALLHQDLDVVERFLRDQLGQNFKTIWVDSEDHYERIVQFVERFQPDLLDRVKLYTRSKPIFDEFKITAELEKALRPKVWLKSGGYIVINQTEALVAIDVNTGKYVGKSDRLEDTIVKTNLEAVQEVVRQMRLRDLGGIIVVDFIDMDDRANRKKVAQALEKEMRHDRAPSKALSFNDFGLVAITRKRVKQSLERALCSPCPTCDGSGYVKSATTVILEILNEAPKMASKLQDAKDVTLRVHPDVARVLKSRDNTFLQEIEEGLRANVLVRGDLSLHRENFDFNV